MQQSKVALVTGAASGIGLALCSLLRTQGYSLAMVDIDQSRLNQECARFKSLNASDESIRISAHHCDVANPTAIEDMLASVIKEHGQLDVLINNAGVAVAGAFSQMSRDDFDWLININFLGLVHLTRICLPHLLARPNANIVNISSIFGIIAPPGQTAYSASKFAVRGFSKALQHELSNTNVSLSIVYPGGVRTRIAEQARKAQGLDTETHQRGLREFKRALVLPPEKAAQVIVEGMHKNASDIYVGTDAKIIRWIEKLLPRHYWPVLEKLMPGGEAIQKIRDTYKR